MPAFQPGFESKDTTVHVRRDGMFKGNGLKHDYRAASPSTPCWTLPTRCDRSACANIASSSDTTQHPQHGQYTAHYNALVPERYRKQPGYDELVPIPMQMAAKAVFKENNFDAHLYLEVSEAYEDISSFCG